MLKKTVLGILAAVMLLALAASSSGEQAGRTLTLMVYMCGSNLESTSGSATEDLQEMMDAMPAGRDISLLVMTGGSDLPEGIGYFQQGNAGIYEVAAGGRIRQVWQPEEAMNMGAQETLETLLRYGQENRPASRYALVLWDHGGGPLEGVCWDEASGMDHLSMAEVTGALEASLEQKLEWIGFDACLMGSLEVACQVAPYADYMIASQEMEPSFGWNYSFLRDLGNDTNGAETGRRIVDAFFEGHEDSRETLTLACIDLAAAGEAAAALDGVFLPLSRELDEEQYLSLSALRMKTTGFGKAEPGYSATGYDLVDARGLAEGIGRTEETEALTERLDRAVVYSRANEEGANGLTLYYPYANKTAYLEKWKAGYRELSFSEGYQAYVEAFGRILTGEALFSWRDLVPEAGEAQPDGSFTFSMPLTEEQAEHVVSAQLLIVQDQFSSRLDDNCVLLASCEAEIGEDNVIRSAWDGRCLFVEDANGDREDPVSFRQTDDGKMRTVVAYYIYEGNYSLQGQTSLVELDAEDTEEYPEIIRVRTWDEATESFSSRLTFSEEGYGSVLFWNLHWSFPGVGEDRVLPDIEDWEDNYDSVVAQEVLLPQEWRLRYAREDSGRQLYAVFRLLDSQQSVVCSIPVEVPNGYRTTAAAVSGGLEDPDLEAGASCTLDTSGDSAGLHLEWSLVNRGEETLRIQARELLLNGTRMTDGSLYETIRPGETVKPDTVFGPYDTVLLGTLESVSGVMEITPEGGETRQVPFSWSFDLDLTALDEAVLDGSGPLAEASADGIAIRLLGFAPYSDCGLYAYVLAENGSGEAFSVNTFALNDIAFSSGTYSKPVEAGKSRVLPLNTSNTLLSQSVKIGAEDFQITYAETWLLQALGIREISGVKVWTEAEESGRKEFTLPVPEPMRLASPVPLSDYAVFYPIWLPPESLEFPQEEKLPVVAEGGSFRILLRRAVAGEDAIALTLEVINDSDEWIEPEIYGGTVNGLEAYVWLSSAVSPHTTRAYEADLDDFSLPEGETEIREITLNVYRQKNDKYFGRESDPAVLIPETPFALAQEGGSWVNGEDFSVATVRFEDIPEDAAEPRALAEDLDIPEDAGSYRISLDTGISPEEAATVKKCMVAVVRENEEGYLQVLTLQNVAPDENGRYILQHPGLIPTVEGDPQIGVMTRILSIDETEMVAEVFLGASLGTINFETVELDEIRWSLDYGTNTAEILSFTQDQAPYTRQSDIVTASFLTYEVSPETREDGTLPHIADMERRSDFLWYLNAPSLRLENKPLRLALRPVTAEDRLQVLVSVIRTDDTRYSLPLIPLE